MEPSYAKHYWNYRLLIMTFYIFDLDGTIVNSSHRAATLPDGSIDLAHWRENSTPEKIMRDSLLPLADTWRRVQQKHRVIVCTARVIQQADRNFFYAHNLRWDFLLSRREGDTTPDAELKLIQLNNLANHLLYSWREFTSRSIMFDDNQSIIELLSKNGLRVIHPQQFIGDNANAL